MEKTTIFFVCDSTQTPDIKKHAELFKKQLLEKLKEGFSQLILSAVPEEKLLNSMFAVSILDLNVNNLDEIYDQMRGESQQDILVFYYDTNSTFVLGMLAGAVIREGRMDVVIVSQTDEIPKFIRNGNKCLRNPRCKFVSYKDSIEVSDVIT